VSLYQSGEFGLVNTATQIDVAPDMLRRWIRDLKESETSLDINERERLRSAERELRLLREENEILKKAVSFFAVETTRNKL